MAHSEDGVITRWYLHDYKGDVLSTYNALGQQTSDHIYSPYGMDYDRLAKTSQAFPVKLKLAGQTPWWKSHSPGFDNQMNDPATGYQFLGGGYRAYNPIYRHFMSHDSFSPFKTIDGYGFASNNPIMNTDPTGHLPQWLSYAMAGAGIAIAIASAILLPVISVVVLPATGAVAAAGTTAASIGLDAAFLGGTTGAIGVASGSLQIASTAHPENSDLAGFSLGFGIANGFAAIAMGAVTAEVGIEGVTEGIETVVNSFAIISGASGSLSGVTGEGDSGMSLMSMADPNLAKTSGWEVVEKVLGYSSMGLMAVSVASSMASPISALAMKLSNMVSSLKGNEAGAEGALAEEAVRQQRARIQQRQVLAEAQRQLDNINNRSYSIEDLQNLRRLSSFTYNIFPRVVTQVFRERSKTFCMGRR